LDFILIQRYFIILKTLIESKELHQKIEVKNSQELSIYIPEEKGGSIFSGTTDKPKEV